MRVLSTLDGIAYSVPASPIDSARLDLIFVQINVEDEVCSAIVLARRG